MMLSATTAAGRDILLRLHERLGECPDQNRKQQTGKRPAHEQEDFTTSQGFVTPRTS